MKRGNGKVVSERQQKMVKKLTLLASCSLLFLSSLSNLSLGELLFR